MKKNIKIITLGPSGVGKTSIIERIINIRFEDFSTYRLGLQNKKYRI